MRKNILYVLLGLVSVSSCKQKTTKQANTNKENINEVYEQYWEQRARFFPLEATQQGDDRYNNFLANDQTQSFRDSLQAFYKNYAVRLKSFNRDSLSENDRISYDIFNYEMEMQLQGMKFNQWEIPFQQFWGLPLTMGQLGSGDGFQPFKTAQDYQNWLGRVNGFAVWADSAISNFRKGIKAGVVLPAVLVKKMIPQMQAMVVDSVEKSLFYGPVTKFPPDFPQEQQEKFKELYGAAIRIRIVPTYKKLADFLKNEYLPHARRTSGISALPGGRKMYDYLVKYYTTTTMTPDEIYHTGLREVERIHAEMEKVKEEVGYAGTLQSFLEYLRSSPRFMPFKSPKDILNAFEGIHQRIEPNLGNIFGRKPKTPFEIRRTEAFREASASAEYSSGSADGKRPGIFYVPVPDAARFNITSGMESLFLHEAIPGHHYQISLQQENKELPKFRRFAWYGAYGEGWALYAESLGKELGLYADPYQYMGALGDEMHRAVRLVVDVAIHTKGMSRVEAIKYMMQHEAISEEGAVAEIERYMAIPAQALSYKIGAMKIRELRSRYEKELGADFREAEFHDEVLKDGCMPLSVLEKKMDAWKNSL